MNTRWSNESICLIWFTDKWDIIGIVEMNIIESNMTNEWVWFESLITKRVDFRLSIYDSKYTLSICFALLLVGYK